MTIIQPVSFIHIPEFIVGEMIKLEKSSCPILTPRPVFPANTLFMISYKKWLKGPEMKRPTIYTVMNRIVII